MNPGYKPHCSHVTTPSSDVYDRPCDAYELSANSPNKPTYVVKKDEAGYMESMEVRAYPVVYGVVPSLNNDSVGDEFDA